VDILAILEKNKNKSFVQRILNPKKYPVKQNKDGSVSTHLMSWTESDGKYYVYPTLLMTKDGLKQYDPDEAWKHVKTTGNFIEFDLPQEADFFSKHYKDIWE
jgi:hypothetical protein